MQGGGTQTSDALVVKICLMSMKYVVGTITLYIFDGYQM